MRQQSSPSPCRCRQHRFELLLKTFHQVRVRVEQLTQTRRFLAGQSHHARAAQVHRCEGALHLFSQGCTRLFLYAALYPFDRFQHPIDD